MEQLKNLISVRIKLQRKFLYLYGFMLLSGSIECITTMKVLKNLWIVRINRYNENFLYLYGFMLLSGSIESYKHNRASEIFDKNSDK